MMPNLVWPLSKKEWSMKDQQRRMKNARGTIDAYVLDKYNNARWADLWMDSQIDRLIHR